jgi:hypothetical protein
MCVLRGVVVMHTRVCAGEYVACMRERFKFVAVDHCVEELVDCQFIQNVFHSLELYFHKVPLSDVTLRLCETK